MTSFFDPLFREIDQKIAAARPEDVPRLFEQIPLDKFGELLLTDCAGFPNLAKVFPVMAPVEVQNSWTGGSGAALLKLSVDFVKDMVDERAISRKGFKVLDYGCGWGRHLRLMHKYVPVDHLYGVDAWDLSLQHCTTCGIKAHLALCDYVPRSLPFDERFDLIYAFSVFTHLSEKTTLTVLRTLADYLAEDGTLVITIRPKEYWHFHDGGSAAAEMIEQHDRTGFAFKPHNRTPIDGEITYGDTSLTLEWLAQAQQTWKVDRFGYSLSDPYQIILYLRRV